ncbi:hypothetical protein [Cellulomonas sp. URHD0024]|uniref:hypothetical protein n=1 Tax=Cellulomonas sp. URHD0024 TaxID=1302620 RepID=UPI0003FD3618|nr:hypothetical protein [Cellulomonas sp. URHD0024]
MADLTHSQSREHDVRSMVAVVVSGVVLVALLVAAAGVVGAVVDLAGWAVGGR